jgi:hypothetical protein
MTDGARKWPEWDSHSLEDWQVDHCWTYEFTRLLPGLVRRVIAWRKQVPKREGQDLFEAYHSCQGGSVTPFILIERKLFMIPLGAYYLLPDWPDTPFLEMPPVRFQQLKKLPDYERDWFELLEADMPGGPTAKERFVWKRGRTELREIDPHPGEYKLNPVGYIETEEQASQMRWEDDAWKSFTESLRKNILRSNKMRAFRSDSEELAILRIPWVLSDKQLLVLFSKWLASNRPEAFKKPTRLGRSSPLAKKRTELGYLRKYLIVQETGTWKTKVKGIPLFRDRSRWNECRKAVEKILADLGSYPGCTI